METTKKVKMGNAIVSMIVFILLLSIDIRETVLFGPMFAIILVFLPIMFIAGMLTDNVHLYHTAIFGITLFLSLSLLIEGSTLLRPSAFILFIYSLHKMNTIIKNAIKKEEG